MTKIEFEFLYHQHFAKLSYDENQQVFQNNKNTECKYCKKVWQAQFEYLGQIIGLVFNVIGVYRIITGVSNEGSNQLELI